MKEREGGNREEDKNWFDCLLEAQRNKLNTHTPQKTFYFNLKFSCFGPTGNDHKSGRNFTPGKF